MTRKHLTIDEIERLENRLNNPCIDISEVAASIEELDRATPILISMAKQLIITKASEDVLTNKKIERLRDVVCEDILTINKMTDKNLELERRNHDKDVRIHNLEVLLREAKEYIENLFPASEMTEKIYNEIEGKK